jgi:hypothetical protein
VWDVITDPSADAARPTVTTVHSSRRASPDVTSAVAADHGNNTAPVTESITNRLTKDFMIRSDANDVLMALPP